MCSLFGYIAKTKKAIPLSVLYDMAKENVARGPHAFGFAWVTRDGRLRAYKQTGRITDYMGLFSMARDACMLVGHVRWATHGPADNNLNNHPHPVDGGWIVHNGVVHNYEDLVESHDMNPVTECDSESIALLVEMSEGKILPRVARAMAELAGNQAIMSIWARPARLVVARAGNPLYTSENNMGVFFSTSPAGLPDGEGSKSLRDNQAAEFTFADDTKGVLNVRVQKIQVRTGNHVSSYAGAGRGFGRGGDETGYRGG